jgi:hypothetical protein
MSLKKISSLACLSLTIIAVAGCGGGSSSPAVIDINPPSLSLKGANPLSIDLNTPFTDPGATAQDDIDGDISNLITQTNDVDINTAGCYGQSYQAVDAAGNVSTSIRTVFVGNDLERHSPNSPPFALQDSTSIPYTSTVTMNILDNDTDPDCDPLSIISISLPTMGTAVVNADGSISFDPMGNIGSHSFLYTISDNHGGTSTEGVTIASHDPDDGNDSWPVIVSDNATTTKNVAIFINLLANDSDADGEIIKVNTGTGKFMSRD